MKPSLASAFMIFGRVNASDRNSTFGIARLHLADQPFPERERLGVRIVDAEDADALLHPEQDDVAQRLPQRDAVGAVEIRIDDVLVFLRRVLGISDRAVGPALEPFRMLLQPGMIRRALDGEVERHLHVEAAAGVDEAAEIVERAELGMHRVVAALPAADRVGAARIVRARPSAHCSCPCGWSCRSDGSA